MSTDIFKSPATVKDLAKLANSFFTSTLRKEGDEQTRILIVKSEAPEWVRELVHVAGGYGFPDDNTYRRLQFIEECLDALVEQDDEDDEDDARDSLEASIYNQDLTAWLHSSVQRLRYVDDAMEQVGDSATCSITNRLMYGQLLEKWEVFDAVVSFLKERAE